MSIDWLIDGAGDMFANNDKGILLKSEFDDNDSTSQKKSSYNINDIKEEILDIKSKIFEQDDKFQLLEELKELIEEKFSPRLVAAGRKKKANI